MFCVRGYMVVKNDFVQKGVVVEERLSRWTGRSEML